MAVGTTYVACSNRQYTRSCAIKNYEFSLRLPPSANRQHSNSHWSVVDVHQRYTDSSSLINHAGENNANRHVTSFMHANSPYIYVTCSGDYYTRRYLLRPVAAAAVHRARTASYLSAAVIQSGKKQRLSKRSRRCQLVSSMHVAGRPVADQE